MAYSASDNDIVARYIKSLSLYSSDRKKLKYSAFMNNNKPMKEISVFQIKDLVIGFNENEIWNIANEYIYKNSEIKVKARGDLTVSEVRKIICDGNNLDVMIDGIPMFRHGNIKFQPSNEEIEKLVAIDLANKANAVLVKI